MLTAYASAGCKAHGKNSDKIKSSPNFKDGRFVNSIPAIQPPIFETMKEWTKGGDHRTPESPIPVIKRKKSDFEQLPESGLRITWFGHSSCLVEVDGMRLLLDPMWSDRSSPYTWAGPKRFFDPPIVLKELPPIDGVLISHDHYDHLDKPTIEKLADTGTAFYVPLGVGGHLRNWGVPGHRIIELDWWQSTKLGPLTITSTPARHFSGRSIVMADRDKTLWSGFAIIGPKHRVYYSGDTGMFEGFAEIGRKLGPFDVSMIEVGAYHRLWADLHLGPEQAVQAFQQVRGGLLIPVHWATFDLALHSWTEPAERLMVAAKRTGISVVIPQPGQSVEPSDPSELTRWWPFLPWQSADKHPIVSSGLQSKSSIADTPAISVAE